jgi:hypothetical protein
MIPREGGLVKKWDLNTSYSLEMEALFQGTPKLQDTRNIKVFTLVDFQL